MHQVTNRRRTQGDRGHPCRVMRGASMSRHRRTAWRFLGARHHVFVRLTMPCRWSQAGSACGKLAWNQREAMAREVVDRQGHASHFVPALRCAACPSASLCAQDAGGCCGEKPATAGSIRNNAPSFCALHPLRGTTLCHSLLWLQHDELTHGSIVSCTPGSRVAPAGGPVLPRPVI